MMSRILPKKKRTGAVPVYLNVSDLTPMNGYAYWLGLGIYHSGVQVHGVEYAFGAPSAVVFEGARTLRLLPCREGLKSLTEISNNPNLRYIYMVVPETVFCEEALNT